MKLIPRSDLSIRVTPTDLVPGVYIRKDVVTSVQEGFVYTQDEMGVECLIGIIPHVLTDVNKRKCVFGHVEWEKGDIFSHKGKTFWTIASVKGLTVHFCNHLGKRIQKERAEFEEMLRTGELEPILNNG